MGRERCIVDRAHQCTTRLLAKPYCTVVFVVQGIADVGIILQYYLAMYMCGSLVTQGLQAKPFVYKYIIAKSLHPAMSRVLTSLRLLHSLNQQADFVNAQNC